MEDRGGFLMSGLYREYTKDQIQIRVDCTLACLKRMNITTVEYTGAGTQCDVVIDEIQQ